MPKISRTKEMVPMPAGFVPGPSHVICAKGKQAKQHQGNCLLRQLVQSSLKEYSACDSKLDRSFIVSRVLKNIRKEGGFVRFVNGEWHEIGDRNAREKIGQAYRDALHTQFRSSTKAKAVIRRRQRCSFSTASSANSDTTTITTSSSTSGDGSICSLENMGQLEETPAPTEACSSGASVCSLESIDQLDFPSSMPACMSFPPTNTSCDSALACISAAQCHSQHQLREEPQLEFADLEPIPLLEPLPLSQAFLMDFNRNTAIVSSNTNNFVAPDIYRNTSIVSNCSNTGANANNDALDLSMLDIFQPSNNNTSEFKFLF